MVIDGIGLLLAFETRVLCAIVTGHMGSYVALLSDCTTYCCWQFALQPSIGIVLGFIGTKMVFDFFGKQLEPSTSSCFLTLIFIIHLMF